MHSRARSPSLAIAAAARVTLTPSFNLSRYFIRIRAQHSLARARAQTRPPPPIRFAKVEAPAVRIPSTPKPTESSRTGNKSSRSCLFRDSGESRSPPRGWRARGKFRCFFSCFIGALAPGARAPWPVRTNLTRARQVLASCIDGAVAAMPSRARAPSEARQNERRARTAAPVAKR